MLVVLCILFRKYPVCNTKTALKINYEPIYTGYEGIISVRYIFLSWYAIKFISLSDIPLLKELDNFIYLPESLRVSLKKTDYKLRLSKYARCDKHFD